MTPVIYNDVLAVVSVLSAAPPERHAEMIMALIREADQAELYRRRYRSAHPVFGDGSLMGAALRHKQRGPVSFGCAEDLTAWIVVLEALKLRHETPKSTFSVADKTVRMNKEFEPFAYSGR